MPAITVDRTAVVIADKIPATQREIVKMQITQVLMFLDNVEIIDFYDNDKMEKYIDAEDVPIVKVTDSWTCQDWETTFIHFKHVVGYYRNIIIINSPVLRFMDSTPEELIKKYESKAMEDPTYAFTGKSKQVRMRILRLLFVKACAKAFGNKNVYQFVLNPREIDYRKVWDFRWYKRIGPWEWEGTELGPTYECALANMYIQEINKMQDFYWYACKENKPAVEEFGYLTTVFLNKRVWSAWWMNAITGGAGVFSKTETRSKTVPQEEYYYNLMLSRYTLISETDDGSFPIVRFMEAVILGCIPILAYNVNYKILKGTLTDQRFYDIIKYRNLKVPEYHYGPGTKGKSNSICNMCERFKVHKGDDVDVIKELRTSAYYKFMTDVEQVKKYYESLIKGAKYGKRV